MSTGTEPSVIRIEDGKVTVMTGELVTVFSCHNDAAAAAQVVLLHDEILRLRMQCERAVDILRLPRRRKGFV